MSETNNLAIMSNSEEDTSMAVKYIFVKDTRNPIRGFYVTLLWHITITTIPKPTRQEEYSILLVFGKKIS